jgi:L-iditol 2-dehydrogenase
MRAAVVEGPETLRVTDVDDPTPSAGEAVVRVHEGGICGTDLKILSGAVPVPYPLILGHEIIGEVVEPGRRGLFPAGARVLVDPMISCGHCRWCRADETHLCPNGGLMGRDVHGGLAEYVAVDELQLLAVPDHIPFEHGPLLQILGTCVHGQTMVDAGPGQVALVVGLGISGLLHTQVLRARGVETVIGTTRSPEKLELARQLGATATAPPDEVQELVDELTDGRGADLVVESSGSLPGLRTAVEAARVGGTVFMFGTLSDTGGDFPWYLLYYKELALVSSRAARWRDYAAAIDYVAQGRVEVAPLLTRRFSLEDTNEALRVFREEPVLKVTARVDSDG